MTSFDTRPAWPFLLASLSVFIAVRFALQPTHELNIDTSAWISSAISAARSDAPLWTLLNYSDSRPLTVFPLFILEFFGIPVDWALAGNVGVVLWGFTIAFFYAILRRWFTDWQALFYALPLLIFQTTNIDADYLSYNSEHICVLMLTIGFWVLLQFEKNQKTAWQYLLAGFWLGMLPFAKMQTVPMGLVLGFFFALFAFRRRQHWGVFALLVGSILPTLLVNLYYFQKGEISTFWNDYFWNYYYYSFTKTYSGVPVSSRFGPTYIFTFFFKIPANRVFWATLFAVLLVGAVAVLRKIKAGKMSLFNQFWYNTHSLVSLFFLASLYAVLQSGNQFSHYLLLLVVPVLLVAALLIQFIAQPYRKWLWVVFVVAIGLEGIHNLYQNSLETPPQIPVAEIAVCQKIEQLVMHHQKMSIWGYSDRFFVWSRVAAGNRLSHTFWVYWPSLLIDYRQRQFLQDMNQNQTDWFLDFSTSNIQHNDKKFRHDNFPKIAAYIRKNYQLVQTVQGVRFYQRNNNH